MTTTTDGARGRLNRLTRSPKPFIVHNYWDNTFHPCIAPHAIAAEEMMERILGNCCVAAYCLWDKDSKRNLDLIRQIEFTH